MIPLRDPGKQAEKSVRPDVSMVVVLEIGQAGDGDFWGAGTFHFLSWMLVTGVLS